MAGSSFGNQFRITTWGESHGKGLGVVIDGCPAGLSLSEEDIQKYLDRRKPGVSQYVTKRKESDTAKIMSGVFEGRTTGTPISIMVLNEDQRSADYSDIEMFYRPGHADYTFDSKYGFRDYRGGGRSSGRETIARVAAGAVAAKILKELGIEITAYTQCIGGIGIDYSRFDIEERDRNPFSVPDKEAAVSIENKAKETIENFDSLGGIIECVVKGMPAGIGEPVFDKLDAQLSKAVMSIGATKGIEIGDGFMVAETTGSENNDEFYNDNGHIAKRTNHSGGVLGGMSDGSDIIFRTAIKPTPSISSLQSTVSRNGDEMQVCIKGRHDPVIVPRAVVVVETMAAFAAAVKIDSFAYLPAQDFANAFSTFVAQNYGAGHRERLRNGFRKATGTSVLVCCAISAAVVCFAEPLLRIFVQAGETEVLASGVLYLRIEGACYAGIGCLMLLYGFYRAVERPGMSLVLTVISLGTRVALAYAVAGTLGEIGVWIAIPIGWLLADAAGYGFYALRRETLLPPQDAGERSAETGAA